MYLNILKQKMHFPTTALKVFLYGLKTHSKAAVFYLANETVFSSLDTT